MKATGHPRAKEAQAIHDQWAALVDGHRDVVANAAIGGSGQASRWMTIGQIRAGLDAIRKQWPKAATAFGRASREYAVRHGVELETGPDMDALLADAEEQIEADRDAAEEAERELGWF